MPVGGSRPYVLRCAFLAVALVSAGCSPRSSPPSQSVLEVPRLVDGDAGATTGGIRIRRIAPKVGAKWSVATRADSDAPDPQAGGTQRSSYISEYQVEVLALDGPAIGSVRLHFTRNAQAFHERETPTALNGNTYVVTRTAPFVQSEGGAETPASELQRVLDIFPDLGTRSRIDEVLPDEPMSIGDRRDELAAAILRTIHPRAWTLERGKATLVRATAEDAIFEVALDATSERGVSMKLEGEATVRLSDARLSLLTLAGPYVTKDKPEETGQFRLRRQVTDVP